MKDNQEIEYFCCSCGWNGNNKDLVESNVCPNCGQRGRLNEQEQIMIEPDIIIVAMLEFKGKIYVATQKGVYIFKDDKLIKLEFEVK